MNKTPEWIVYLDVTIAEGSIEVHQPSLLSTDADLCYRLNLQILYHAF